jgi:hypothetical protein
VSGDISPPGGSWLDTPARPGGQPGRTPAVGRPDRGEPSLARVVGTTLRLWWRRRVLRVADGARVGTFRWAAIAVALAVVAAACVTAALAGARAVPSPPPHHVAVKPTAAQLQALANERAAGQWIAAQVPAGTPLACDPGMCGYLVAAGVSDYMAIGSGRLAAGAAVPAGVAFVISTPALRKQAGSQLAAGAPEVIAAFGTGQGRVDVLVPAASKAAFLETVQSQVAASAQLGRALARNRRLHISLALRAELGAGQVDQRLLIMLQHMLVAHTVEVIGFGDPDPGASWPAQLRSVTIGGLIHHQHGRLVSQLTGDVRVVHALQSAANATTQQITAPGGGPELVIQVMASS